MNPHFASLVLGLAHQAQQALAGRLPPEAGATPPRDVARSLIDTLAMLEEKTQGRLDDEELRLLAQALTELRFAFVRAGGTA